MENKKNIHLSNMLENISRTNVFDKLITEVEADEIPARYIQQLIVYYADGKIVELSGDDVMHSIPMNKNARWRDMKHEYHKIADVKIYINTVLLERDVNRQVRRLLGKFMG